MAKDEIDLTRAGIYKILNKINGKFYIGSAKNLINRWKQHQNRLNCSDHHNKHLQNAWNKYGSHSFEFEILEFCLLEELEEKENCWMKLTNCNELGYNKRIDAASNRGFKHSEESKEKIRQSNTGQKRSDELKEKLRNRIVTDEWCKNISLGGKGKKLSQEAKDKISAILKERDKEIYVRVANKNRGQVRRFNKLKRMIEPPLMK